MERFSVFPSAKPAPARPVSMTEEEQPDLLTVMREIDRAARRAGYHGGPENIAALLLARISSELMYVR